MFCKGETNLVQTLLLSGKVIFEWQTFQSKRSLLPRKQSLTERTSSCTIQGIYLDLAIHHSPALSAQVYDNPVNQKMDCKVVVVRGNAAGTCHPLRGLT